MEDSIAVISTIAAVVSAVGGAFAAVAAFRASGFARDAHQAAQLSEKCAAFRQLTVTANEVLVEARRGQSRGSDLKAAYRTLAVFSGASGGSHETLYVSEVDRKLSDISNLAESASPFSSDQENLINGPVEEINSRETRMAQILTAIRAVREDLEREHASIEAQCATFREKAIQRLSQ